MPQLFYALALRRQFLSSAAGNVGIITACSRFIGDRLSLCGFLSRPVLHAPLGIHPFRPLPRSPGSGRTRFTFLGTIYFTKGLDLLLRAFERLPQGRAELNIFGHVIDQGYFQEAMNRVRDKTGVRYRGPYRQEDIPLILAETDAAVIPSRVESYSIVARECLHAGVPVIGPDVGGVPEIVRHGRNGLLFRTGDVEGLAENLQLLLNDPRKLDELRMRIEPVRTIEDEAAELEDTYMEQWGIFLKMPRTREDRQVRPMRGILLRGDLNR
jgi:glycosyltransferase involved in cell wall biosynthesis